MFHDFSASFCEINLKMTIYNSSIAAVNVKVKGIDRADHKDLINQHAGTSMNLAGWHDISLVNEPKVSDANGSRTGSPQFTESVTPFIWSGTSTTTIRIEPMSTTEIPLQISVFSPGIHDLSNYVLYWNLLHSPTTNPEDSKQLSGACRGYPYLLTVLPPA